MFIQLKNYVPEIYYKQSRDFQLLGRLYDIVLNSVSANIDMIYSIPNTEYASSNLIELLALTLGFKPKHDYNLKHLVSVCSILPSILQVKGTLVALDLICRALLSAEGLTGIYEIRPEASDPYRIFILIPNLESYTLLNDLLDYVLPAGVSCRIITSEFTLKEFATTQIGVTTTNVAWNYGGIKYGKGLASNSEEGDRSGEAAKYWEKDRPWNVGEYNNLLTRSSLAGVNSSQDPEIPIETIDPTYAIPGDISNSIIGAQLPQPPAQDQNPENN